MPNPYKSEHALVLEGSRNLRGRWRTLVRRLIRENKALELFKQTKIPTFEEYIRTKELDDTYSRRFSKYVRQNHVEPYMDRVNALPDKAAFRESFGKHLSKFIEGKDVIVSDGISHSDNKMEQPTLWFTTRRTPKIQP